MEINRRQFLAVTVAGAGGAILARTGLGADPAPTTTPPPTPPERPATPAASALPANPYDIVPLGKTGLKVSRIAMGTGMRGSGRQSNQTRLGQEKFDALLKDGFDRGVRLFDMADLYGSHTFVGRALKDKRDKAVFQTKIWTNGGGIPEQERLDANLLVDRFRKELQTDYIDIVLIHCMTSPKWTDEQKKQMDILDDLKSKGIIKAHGISAHSLVALQLAAKSPWVDTVNARINHAGQSMDAAPALVSPVLKDLHDAGKGVAGMKLIGEGKWRDDPGNRDKAIRYVLDLGTVDSMIVGFEKPAELDDFEKRVATAMATPAAAATG